VDRISLGREATAEPRAVRAALKAFLPDAGKEVTAFAATLVEREKEIAAWLADDEEARLAFARDPVATLTKRFPDLQVPKRTGGRLPEHLGELVGVAPSQSALELLQRVWDFAAASDANAAAVRADPLAVVAGQATGFPAAVVNEVNAAILTVNASAPQHLAVQLVELARVG
jgi:hypothetical protein